MSSKQFLRDSFFVGLWMWFKKYFLSLDGAIGIRWDKFTCCSSVDTHVLVKIGLEQHRIYDFSNLGSDGSLSLDGGVLEVGFGLRF